MIIEYEIREADGRFWVGHFDENGEWWDADLSGFDTIEEAEIFLAEKAKTEITALSISTSIHSVTSSTSARNPPPYQDRPQPFPLSRSVILELSATI